MSITGGEAKLRKILGCDDPSEGFEDGSGIVLDGMSGFATDLLSEMRASADDLLFLNMRTPMKQDKRSRDTSKRESLFFSRTFGVKGFVENNENEEI
jgi:hypothetical protein